MAALFQLLADCGASRCSDASAATAKMPTHTAILDTPPSLASNCFVRDCRKPRFEGYYVCAEHFVIYASPKYTQSMVIKVDPIGFWQVHPHANCSNSSQLEHSESDPIGSANTGKATNISF